MMPMFEQVAAEMKAVIKPGFELQPLPELARQISAVAASSIRL